MPVSVNEVIHIRIKPTPLPLLWFKWLGALPIDKQWTALVSGGSYKGKSSIMLRFSKILSRFGKVLYANFEEDATGGTLQVKLKQNGIRSNDIYFLDSRSTEDLKNELATGKYKYCVVDSITAICDTPKETSLLFKELKEFKDVSFLFVFHADKEEANYIGSSKFKHMVDIMIDLIMPGVASIRRKNRWKSDRDNLEFDIFKNKLLTQNEYENLPIFQRSNKRKRS